MFKLGRKERLIATIAISLCFFAAELAAGFYTRSLALVADAFHYLSDLIGFVVALTAVLVSERANPPPQEYTFGYQRATLLGAFFNGVFLLALGVSILVQAIERFTNITPVENPKIVLIVGSVGLGLNLLVMSFLHEHDHGDGHGHSHSHSHSHSHGHGHGHSHSHSHEHAHSVDVEIASTDSSAHVEEREYPLSHGHREHKHSVSKPQSGRDLGMLGVLIHVIGDAINNVGVIVSALVIWKTEGENRYYIDPAIGVFIAVMIFLTALPLTKHSGGILLQIAPGGIDMDDVKHDIEMIPGVESVHELHIWRLNQHKSIASAHIVVDAKTVKSFTEKAKVIMECLHAYGVHSATLQPEVLPDLSSRETIRVLAGEKEGHGREVSTEVHQPRKKRSQCQLVCSNVCDGMRCCPPAETR